jgi:hypothetical protein
MTHSAPEHWATDAGDADVALLDVPPAEARARRFEIDVRFVVRCPDRLAEAWHALTVELDAGAPLRIRALAQAHGARRLQLRIDAEEG